MRIKQEFFNKIITGEKTVELRKVSKIGYYITPKNFELSSGRYKIPLENELGKIIGSITINGFSIIENPFIQINKEFKEKMISIIPRQFKNWNEFDWKKWIIESYFDDANRNWIFKNWDWLTEYFKDEEEILVLKIESWKKHNE